MPTGRPDDASGHRIEPDAHVGGRPGQRLEFHSDTLAAPFIDRLSEPLSIQIEAIVLLPDETHLQYWTVTDGRQSNLIELFEAFPTTLDVRLLSTTENTHRLEVHGAVRSLFSTLHRFGGITQSAVYDDRGVHVTADVPADADVAAITEAVHELYPDLELVSSMTIRSMGVVRPEIESRLTTRQLTALRLAFYSGYFEQPRRSTGQDLARRMGISKQAFHEHLRKAYAVVFELVFEGDVLDEELDQ